MNDTCVYRHLKPCGEVFYVGIGCAQRPFDTTRRNQFWYNVVAKYGYEVEIVAEGLNWVEACKLEKSLIKLYGRRDLGTGTLVNLTDGGEGVKGLIHSTETRQKLSAAHIGKKHSREARQKISAAHSGKNLSKEHRQKLSDANSGKKLSKETRQKLRAVKQKLTYEQAEEIRRRYKTEKTSHQKLGQKYGVSSRTIGYIINNKTYST